MQTFVNKQEGNIMSEEPVTTNKTRSGWLIPLLAVIGPGLAVMLADTDAGSITVAAQSGAVWGYKLLALQIILVPILYIAQELTVRLGLVTGRGHAELIKNHFGKFWAWISVTTMMISCMGAILTEFTGIVGVGALFGIDMKMSLILVIAFLIIVAWTGSYHSVERIAIAIGAFELVFLYVAWRAHPSMHEILSGFRHMPLNNKDYLYLMAANIGAVIMPWMIFYQQSAVIDKGLSVQHLKAARFDTALGSVVTQLIMASVLIAAAATIGKTNPGAPLNTVHQISDALVPFLGETTGKILFALGMLGAALIASVVVSLAAAWALGEILGYKRSLEHKPKEAPWFYSVYSLALILGGIFVASGINPVKLNVAVNVMNAFLLPIVLGFLFLLARKTLPEKYKLRGWYAWLVGIILLITVIFGLFAGIGGIF
jgi:NRAMP (natural resistance-associated macrophage protein)-like metal ion transporter